MSLQRWKKVSSEIKFKNPWWTYCFDKCRLPNGKEYEYHYVHTSGSSFIIPVKENGKILLVNQYRYLNDRFSIEFPGGGIRENQSPDFVARKELIEETGFNGDLEKAGYFNPYNGIADEICHVFIARNLYQSRDETKDEQEEFELIELTPLEIEQKIQTNEIYDGMTMASWAIARKYFL
jgi:ADP-ribose pyrophosphatase